MIYERPQINLITTMSNHRPPTTAPIATTAQSTTPTQPTIGLKTSSSSAVFFRGAKRLAVSFFATRQNRAKRLSAFQSFAPQCSQQSAV